MQDLESLTELAACLGRGYAALVEAEDKVPPGNTPEQSGGKTDEGPEDVMKAVAGIAGAVLSPRITETLQNGGKPSWKDILGDAAELGISFIPGVGGVAKLGRLLKASRVGIKGAQLANKVSKSKAGLKAAKVASAAKKHLSPEQQKAAMDFMEKLRAGAVKKVEKELRMDLETTGDSKNYRERLQAQVPKMKETAANYARKVAEKVNSAIGGQEGDTAPVPA